MNLNIRRMTFTHRRGGKYEVVHIGAGTPTVIDNGYFKVTKWPVNLEVTVSPTGRSVHVYLNGKKLDVK